MVYVKQVCWQLAYTIAVCTVKNSWWWTEEMSETCRVLFENKFEKLVHLVGFIIEPYHDAVTWTSNSMEKMKPFFTKVLRRGLPFFSAEKQQYTCIGVCFIFSNGFAFFTCNVTVLSTTIWSILNNPWLCTEQLDMVMTPTNVQKCLYYIHSMAPTCFDHSCGHPQEGALQRVQPMVKKTLQYFDISIPCNATPWGWP